MSIMSSDYRMIKGVKFNRVADFVSKRDAKKTAEIFRDLGRKVRIFRVKGGWGLYTA